MKKIIILGAAILIILSSCMGTKKATESATPATPLYETKWLLKKIHSETGSQEVATKAFIKFTQEKNSAGGNGSCNTFGSTTTVNGSSITFSNIFSTKMFCEDVQQTENTYLKQLAEINSYSINGNTLQLSKNGTVVLEFTAE